MADKNNHYRILVVEDEQFLRELYIEILIDAGYNVDSASDGDEAFHKIHSGGYDLVLLDIVLPKRDGLQILKDLKKDPPVKANKAILILSNLGEEAIISEGVALGIRGHLIKSDYTPEQLLGEVKRILTA